MNALVNRRTMACLIAPVLVAGVLVGSPAAITQRASAAGQVKPARAATQHTSHVELRASTKSMPASRVKKTGSGAIYLTEDGHLQRYVDRSHSPRPRVDRLPNGNRVLARSASPSWLPTVAPTRVSTRRPGAVKGWEGLNEADNQKYAGFSLEPPDQGLCAGRGHVLEMINSVVRVYGTGGSVQRTASLNAFFREPTRQFTTDPSCVYDAGSQRFFATELTLDVDPKTGNLTGRNWLNLAVSKTSDPRGGWRIYTIEVTDDGTGTTPSHKSCPCIGDYPHLGTDGSGVFLTTNEYPWTGDGVFGNGFNGAQIYALSKAKVAAGATRLAVVHLENVRVPLATGANRVGFTLLPAQSVGTAYARQHHGTMYFASSFAAEEARPDDFTGHSDEIGTWWISNTASLSRSAPRLSLEERTLSVGSYGIPPLSNQKPGPVPLRDCLTVQCIKGLSDPYTPEQEGGLDSSDTRMMTAAYVNQTVIAALDTAMQVDQSVQTGYEWFAVRAREATSTVTRHGYVGVARANVIYPAIAANHTGRGYVGFTLTGDNWYPSAGYQTWSARPGTAVHLAAAGAAPQDGFCEYRAFNCGGTPTPSIRPRWGDYSAAVWDGKRFFLANEYIAHRCTYAQFAADFTCGGTRTRVGNFSTHIQRLR